MAMFEFKRNYFLKSIFILQWNMRNRKKYFIGQVIFENYFCGAVLRFKFENIDKIRVTITNIFEISIWFLKKC